MAEILVIDDSKLSQKAISDILNNANHNTIEAYNGLEAIEKIKNDNYDLIILDLLMPKMRGIEFLETIKNNNTNIPVIVLTADIQESTKAHCFELGARKFLNKPVKKEELLKAVVEVLNN